MQYTTGGAFPNKLSTREEIRSIVLDEWTQLKESDYPEDLLTEFADSHTPIMYGDIISEWSDLPMEDTDQWKQFGFDETFEQGGITKLMQVDLYLYYERLFREVFEELREEAKV